MRRVFERERCKKINICNSTFVKTFFRLLGEPILDEQQLKKINGLWGHNFLSNKHREFLFKFYNNTLAINTRVFHFVENNSRSCTFCVANKKPLPFMHLFYECEFTAKILGKMRETFVPEIRLNSITEKKVFWLCGIAPDNNHNIGIFVQLFCLTSMFIIWEHKLKKKLGLFSKTTFCIVMAKCTTVM